jgi:hypothetical protein
MENVSTMSNLCHILTGIRGEGDGDFADSLQIRDKSPTANW